MPPEQEETEEDVPVQKEGVMPESDTESKSSVHIPEDFQKQASSLIEQCDSLHCVEFISSLLSEKRTELYNMKDKGEEPEYSEENMPKT